MLPQQKHNQYHRFDLLASVKLQNEFSWVLPDIKFSDFFLRRNEGCKFFMDRLGGERGIEQLITFIRISKLKFRDYPWSYYWNDYTLQLEFCVHLLVFRKLSI